ncbi:hypothetical protein FGG08_006758 [Glutinoglossum americanum]|uniref:Uncharacterized protein n=1 Tax=Glutinoglossum americanum TaxID=1670608 RepID=A0A9P8I6P7_9PEZI|nr:hypothetical protein FGG08_006758 [Glutinoglossum americanum]
MSSTRPTRKSSRRSSPHRNAGDSPSSAAVEPEKKKEQTLLDSWVEPPLRTPAPSFEDHKGLERHGVLEYMAPLGTLPSAKVKARIKAEPPRRVTQVKNGDSSAPRDRPSTPEATSTPALGTRRSESRKVEDRTPKTPLPRQQLSEKSAISASKALTRSSGKGANGHSLVQETPTTTLTPHRKERLKEIVEQAHNRAVEVGQPDIGFALKQHYEDSLRDSNLADQLEAVLYKTSTPEQTAGFQAYIKKAKKLYKVQPAFTNGTRRSSELGGGNSFKAVSKSPSKSTRSGAASGTRNNVSKLEATEPKASKISNSLKKEIKVKGKQAERNAMSGKDDYVLTRSKSSSSSLSSLSSSLDENFVPPSMEGNHANSTETPAANLPMNNSKSKTSFGPKLHTFLTSNISTGVNGRKRSSSSAGPAQDDTDVAPPTKRQRVTRSFDDVEIQESDTRGSSTVRDSLPNQSSVLRSQLALPVIAPAYPTRLRDGAARIRFLRDDEEDAVSSPTSIPGDLSVPGGASTGGPSRPSTPPLFGPFSKKSKKAARIKMS